VQHPVQGAIQPLFFTKTNLAHCCRTGDSEGRSTMYDADLQKGSDWVTGARVQCGVCKSGERWGYGIPNFLPSWYASICHLHLAVKGRRKLFQEERGLQSLKLAVAAQNGGSKSRYGHVNYVMAAETADGRRHQRRQWSLHIHIGPTIPTLHHPMVMPPIATAAHEHKSLTFLANILPPSTSLHQPTQNITSSIMAPPADTSFAAHVADNFTNYEKDRQAESTQVFYATR